MLISPAATMAAISGLATIAASNCSPLLISVLVGDALTASLSIDDVSAEPIEPLPLRSPYCWPVAGFIASNTAYNAIRPVVVGVRRTARSKSTCTVASLKFHPSVETSFDPQGFAPNVAYAVFVVVESLAATATNLSLPYATELHSAPSGNVLLTQFDPSTDVAPDVPYPTATQRPLP